MHRSLFTAAIAAFLSSSAIAADVGVSIGIGQPGFYGKIDIGSFPQPQLIYRAPITIERVPINRPPIYLHVPPGYESHWRKHCHEYHACREQVFFVQDGWYNREYVPHYRERHPELRKGRIEDHHNERRDGN